MKILFAALLVLGIAVTAVGVVKAQTVSPSPTATPTPTATPVGTPVATPTVPAGAPSTGRG